MLKVIGTCPVCDNPLLCAPGQIIRFHRECRTEGRKKYGKSTGIKKFDVNYRGELMPQAPKIVLE